MVTPLRSGRKKRSQFTMKHNHMTREVLQDGSCPACVLIRQFNERLDKGVNDKRNEKWDLKTGHLYRIRSRNLPYGVYDGRGGFIGIREKFGSLYLFTEYDWDNGPPFGTVVVLEDLGPIPKDIEPIEAWWVAGDERWASGSPRIPEKHLTQEVHYEPNEPLYTYLEEQELAHGRGVGYGGRPGDPEGKTPREIEEENNGPQ